MLNLPSTRRLNLDKDFARVAALTGNVASLFSGGEMVKSPREKWFSESLDDLI